MKKIKTRSSRRLHLHLLKISASADVPLTYLNHNQVERYLIAGNWEC